jgi:hypothetical protein
MWDVNREGRTEVVNQRPFRWLLGLVFLTGTLSLQSSASSLRKRHSHYHETSGSPTQPNCPFPLKKSTRHNKSGAKSNNHETDFS